MTQAFVSHISHELDGLREAGHYKSERVITSEQAGTVALENGRDVANLYANNYLGLSDNADLIDAGRAALNHYGYGMSSVRFIYGTQEEHKELEARLPQFLGREDTILCSSCFDTNADLFETLLGSEDAIISDALRVYLALFSFHVVPRGQDRIRTQMSAAHSRQELDRAIDACITVGSDMGIIQ